MKLAEEHEQLKRRHQEREANQLVNKAVNLLRNARRVCGSSIASSIFTAFTALAVYGYLEAFVQEVLKAAFRE